MKKITNNLVLVILLMLLTGSAFASNTSGEEDLATFTNPADPAGDPGATPVNDYLIPMLVLGIAIGYRLLNKKTALVK